MIKIQNMEKKDWDDNEFTERIRITKEDRDYIKKIKGKTSMARKLQEIISKHRAV